LAVHAVTTTVTAMIKTVAVMNKIVAAIIKTVVTITSTVTVITMTANTTDREGFAPHTDASFARGIRLRGRGIRPCSGGA